MNDDLVEEERRGGLAQQLVENIDALMKNLNWSLQEACGVLNVTVDDYLDARAK